MIKICDFLLISSAEIENAIFSQPRKCLLAKPCRLPYLKEIRLPSPQSADEYVHRIGRTGRMGNTGRATSFYDSDADGAISRDLVKILADAQQV